MPLKRALISLAVVSMLALALGAFWLSGEPTHEGSKPENPPKALNTKSTKQTVTGVVWSYRPSSVDQIVGRTRATVEAEVVVVRSGPDIVSPEPNGDVRIPTQRIEFRTLSTLSGSAPTTFTLFKTGSITAHLEDDPPYNEGEKYVLFIAPRGEGDGTYLPVGPDGRLREESSGRVEPEIEGPVGDELDGMTVDQVKERISLKKMTKKTLRYRR